MFGSERGGEFPGFRGKIGGWYGFYDAGAEEDGAIRIFPGMGDSWF